jgi:hypothetical protein
MSVFIETDKVGNGVKAISKGMKKMPIGAVSREVRIERWE